MKRTGNNKVAKRPNTDFFLLLVSNAFVSATLSPLLLLLLAGPPPASRSPYLPLFDPSRPGTIISQKNGYSSTLTQSEICFLAQRLMTDPHQWLADGLAGWISLSTGSAMRPCPHKRSIFSRGLDEMLENPPFKGNDTHGKALTRPKNYSTFFFAKVTSSCCGARLISCRTSVKRCELFSAFCLFRYGLIVYFSVQCDSLNFSFSNYSRFRGQRLTTSFSNAN